MEALASVNNLSVRYGEVLAVDNLTFDILPGEVLAVIGPNGSGKTSMAECLEGLRWQSGGTVQVFGQDPHTGRKDIYKQMGVQLQSVQYPDKIRVDELCGLFASFYKNPADWKRLLEQLGLGHKVKKPVNKLSGGEKQRLSILLALLPKPRLLVLDELTTGLDPEVRRSLWNSLKTIRDSGTGILLVSHYMDEVQALADRVLFMVSGKAIYIGALKDLPAFAEQKLGHEKWRDDMTLEDIYLALVPQKGTITLEAIK